MKILLFIAVTFFIISCNNEEVVQWQEQNAKYKGVIKYGLVTQVSCCKDGNNCAVREIKDYVPSNGRFMQYISDNNIRGYFENEDWQSMFPELVGHPEIVTQIIQVNPVVKLMDNLIGNKSIVIFQTANPTKINTEDILFVFNNMDKMMPEPPCPD